MTHLVVFLVRISYNIYEELIKQTLTTKTTTTMKVTELTRANLEQLKQAMLCEDNDPSWGELANADEIVDDNEVFARYEGICFVEDDFS